MWQNYSCCLAGAGRFHFRMRRFVQDVAFAAALRSITAETLQHALQVHASRRGASKTKALDATTQHLRAQIASAFVASLVQQGGVTEGADAEEETSQSLNGFDESHPAELCRRSQAIHDNPRRAEGPTLSYCKAARKQASFRLLYWGFVLQDTWEWRSEC
eukprot:g4524.t1